MNLLIREKMIYNKLLKISIQESLKLSILSKLKKGVFYQGSLVPVPFVLDFLKAKKLQKGFKKN